MHLIILDKSSEQKNIQQQPINHFWTLIKSTQLITAAAIVTASRSSSSFGSIAYTNVPPIKFLKRKEEVRKRPEKWRTICMIPNWF